MTSRDDMLHSRHCPPCDGLCAQGRYCPAQQQREPRIDWMWGVANPALANENFSPSHDLSGMTLRDYFAAMAIAAAAGDELRQPTYAEPTYKGTADRAYLYADAMLKARQA